jgi:Glycosyl hydrolases family 2, TIM barrel domain/Glycosyl hydrolases family 2/Glycosyl hydrolases family 2, sugar binding domain
VTSKNLTEAGAREFLSLDGEWEFRHTSDGSQRVAHVPSPWQAQFDDLRFVSGKAIYTRSFSCPTSWRDKQVFLRFGAVSYYCEVCVNGSAIGCHEGGYLPFEFIIPHNQLHQDNTVEIFVVLPNGNDLVTPEFPFAEIPHGKQSWYGPLGGIWQSVTLEARDQCHLQHVRITPGLKSGAVKFDLELSAHSVGTVIRLEVFGPDQKAVGSTNQILGKSIAEARLELSDVSSWSPDTPNLYSVRIAVLNNQTVVDSTSHIFGFRSIETRDGKFYLNGKPLYIRGALDQDYYPDGICTPPSVEFLEDQFRKAKALGLNLLRCHIKVPDPLYYEVADRLGMLIWTEIPNVATFTANSAGRMRETMEGILRRDFNHPSIIIWTLINEDWGTRLIEDASHRRWLKDTYDWLKRLDPTRLVVDNSACHTNFHVKSDINDYHYYRSVPERRDEWDKLTQEFSEAANWTYSPYGDAERRGDEPLVVSEFGVWGLPDPKQLANADGSEPWWMETGAGWGDGAAYPHSVEKRFVSYCMDQVFGSFNNFITTVQWQQFANLKYQIETMRAKSTIQGFVITELTDVHWEANGLLDMKRNPRVFHNDFATINSDVAIVPKVKCYSARSGETFIFGVAVASGGLEIQSQCRLSVWLDQLEVATRPVMPMVGLLVIELEEIVVSLPRTAQNRVARFELKLTQGNKQIASNQFEIGLYAERDGENLPTISSGDGTIADYAKALGYRVIASGKGDVQIAHSLDKQDIAAMQNGARFVVLADGSAKTNGNLRSDQGKREQPFMSIVDETPGNLPSPDSPLPNIVLHNRQGTLWRGDWIANFSWLRREGVFASIPGGPLFDLSFDRVVPFHVMTGFRPWEYAGAVHSGLVLGWVHKPAVMIGERKVGRGGLIASTFRLMRDQPGEDPLAGALFDAQIAAAMKMSLE